MASSEGNASDPVTPASVPPDAAATSSPAPGVHPVIREVLQDPHRQDLFQLLRRLDAIDVDAPRIGWAPRAGRERVRIGQPADLSFAPSTVQRTWMGDDGRLHVHQRAFGMLGPNGPLPLHLTEYIRDRSRNQRDHTLQSFLDVFHHRMASLFYRAWATCQATVSRDRPAEDRFSAFAAALVGLADESLLDRDSLDDDARRFHAGRLSCRASNAAGLEMILGDVLGVPARIVEFAGEWVELPERSWCRIGRDPEGATLGSAVLGRRVNDPQHAFRIRLGPLSHSELLGFLPIGGEFVGLRDWVRTYAERAYAWDVQMIVRAEEVPRTRLGESSWLGWTTWVHTDPPTRDDDRLVFSGEA